MIMIQPRSLANRPYGVPMVYEEDDGTDHTRQK